MKKTIRLFVASLLIILLSAIVVKGVDSSWGSVKVRTGKTISPNGNIMSYKVYIPKDASAQNPAPGLLWMVGGGASLDESSMTAIEASRRGYVVIVPDVPGNGLSEPILSTLGGMDGKGDAVPINSIGEGLNYTSASMEILKSLSMVDKNQLVMGGHSMGGYYVSVMAQQYAEEIQSCIVMGTFGYSGKLDQPTDFNYALIVGKGDESVLSRTTGYKTLSEAIQSDALKEMFNVPLDKTIEVGKLYGSYSDKTARILYNPNEMHMLEPDSAESCKAFLHELMAATTAPKQLSESSLVYWVKDLAMLIGYLGFGLLIYSTVLLLIDSPAFASLKLPIAERYIGYEPKTKEWKLAVCILTVLSGILYIPAYQFYSQFPVVKNLGNAGGKSLWSIGTALMIVIYLMVFHARRGRKVKAEISDYGLATSEQGSFNVLYVLKALLFAVSVLAIVYGCFYFYTEITACNIHVVWFNNELALIEHTKFKYKFIPILMYLLSFIFVNAIAQKTIVGKEENFKKEILTTNLVGTLVMILTFIAFVIGLLGPHVCLFAYNRGCFGAETLLGVAVSFWIINASCYILNKETKSIWTGAFTAAILMTWFTIFATGMTF